jgi:release factor glutamine methyltransferase
MQNSPVAGRVQSIITAMDGQDQIAGVDVVLARGRALLAAAVAPGLADGAALDAELLLAQVLGRTRAQLLALSGTALDAAQQAEYGALLARRATGEPLAYLRGQREFWSLPLAVTPAVLVPRPETEGLVEAALALPLPPDAAVADLGTGSGAIALALATERPDWQVTATDRSAAALAVARANARALGLAHVRFLEGDWLAPLAGQRFHLIASNPPYVDEHDPVLAQPPLRFEPHSALASGAAGMADIHIIATTALGCLEPGGWLLLEHGSGQGEAVGAMLVARGYTHVRCHSDLAGLPRVTQGRRP